MYEEMFEYVKNELATYDVHGGKNKNKINYNRYLHIKRVYHFVHRIYHDLSEDEKKCVNLEALEIATIFHDAGYGQIERTEHATISESICKNYLNKIGYDKDQIDFICYLIANHSKKGMLLEKETPLELIILLEADLLDDTGAHGIVMDVWIEALNENVTFESMLEHIKQYTYAEMHNNLMRTEPAKRIWEQKRKLTDEFVKQYEMDLEY